MSKSQIVRSLARKQMQKRSSQQVRKIDKSDEEVLKQIENVEKFFKAFTAPKGGDIA